MIIHNASSSYTSESDGLGVMSNTVQKVLILSGNPTFVGRRLVDAHNVA